MNFQLKSILALSLGWSLLAASTANAQKARMEAYRANLVKSIESKMPQGAKCQILLEDSSDRGGMDVEIRLTMPIKQFMEFAPVAALEAAGIPHKFPTVYIVLREETTDRVGRVAFADAEPIAGRYLAGEKNPAIEEMKKAIRWH